MRIRKYLVHFGTQSTTVVNSIKTKGRIEHLRHSVWGPAAKPRMVPPLILEVPFVYKDIRTPATGDKR